MKLWSLKYLRVLTKLFNLLLIICIQIICLRRFTLDLLRANYPWNGQHRKFFFWTPSTKPRPNWTCKCSEYFSISKHSSKHSFFNPLSQGLRCSLFLSELKFCIVYIFQKLNGQTGYSQISADLTIVISLACFVYKWYNSILFFLRFQLVITRTLDYLITCE